MRDPFKVLGIEPTSDKKQIKKAYAKLAARYHPEEYPEKWQEIHEAYEAAIQFASAIGEDAWTEEEEQKKSDSFSGLENRAEAVPESVPEAISLEKSKDIEEEETAFDFEHILSKLEKVQKEEQDRILQELLTFLEPLRGHRNRKQCCGMYFFSLQFFGKINFSQCYGNFVEEFLPNGMFLKSHFTSSVDRLR